MKLREGEIAKGRAPGISFDKVMFSDLIKAITEDYKLKGQKRPRVGHLEKFFEGYRVVDVTTSEIKRYITYRKEKVKNATIKLELAALKRMFNLGTKETPPKVDRVPDIPHIEVNNVKEGFFEDSDYNGFVEKLPEYLKGPVMFAYWTGWRKSQIFELTWKMVDLKERVIEVSSRLTKSNKPHIIYLNEPLMEIVKDRRSEINLGCPYVFHRKGQPIRDFRFEWNKACRELGLGYGYKLDDKYAEKWGKELKPGPTFHDFRRTATRNLIRSGVPEKIAMSITGHKTRAVFERYNIVDKRDLKWAAEKQAENYHKHNFKHNLAKNEI